MLAFVFVEAQKIVGHTRQTHLTALTNGLHMKEVVRKNEIEREYLVITFSLF